MAAISSLTTRSGKPRALSGAAIRMLGHDVDGEPTRFGDSLRTAWERDAHGAAGYGRLRRKNSRNSEQTAPALPSTNPAPTRNP